MYIITEKLTLHYFQVEIEVQLQMFLHIRANSLYFEAKFHQNITRLLAAKGQTKLKQFSSRRFFQKTNKRILHYYYETSSRLVFVPFLEELKTPKRHFNIN